MCEMQVAHTITKNKQISKLCVGDNAINIICIDRMTCQWDLPSIRKYIALTQHLNCLFCFSLDFTAAAVAAATSSFSCLFFVNICSVSNVLLDIRPEKVSLML